MECLYADGCLDVWMWVIVGQGEVLILEREDVLDGGVDVHVGQRSRVSCQLQLGLLDVVEVKGGVASGVDEVTWFETTYLCYHHCQQGVGGDVEWHSEEGVCTSLVELAAQFAVGDIKLEEYVAWGQVHVVDVCYVPC